MQRVQGNAVMPVTLIVPSGHALVLMLWPIRRNSMMRVGH